MSWPDCISKRTVAMPRCGHSLFYCLKIGVFAFGLTISQTALMASDPFEALGDRSLALTYSQADVDPIPYRLFLPKAFDAEKEYPLILWLHGVGEQCDDNVSQLRHVDRTLYCKGLDGPSPFFVLAPQLSKREDQYWDSQVTDDGDDMLAMAMQIIEDVKKNYPIDESRISAIGISSGGTACWALADRYGDRFAAITVQGGGGRRSYESPGQRLLTTPIWAFHETGDPKIPVAGIRETIASLQSEGANAHLTEIQDQSHSYSNSAHNCWNTAFVDYDLLHWMLSQTQGETSLRPGQYRLRAYPRVWWNRLRSSWNEPDFLLFLLSILFAIGVVAYRHFKKLNAHRDNLLPKVFSDDLDR